MAWATGWLEGGRGRGCNNIERYRSLIRHAAREREIRSQLDEKQVLAIFSPLVSLASSLSRSLSLPLSAALLFFLCFPGVPLRWPSKDVSATP